MERRRRWLAACDSPPLYATAAWRSRCARSCTPVPRCMGGSCNVKNSVSGRDEEADSRHLGLRVGLTGEQHAWFTCGWLGCMQHGYMAAGQHALT